MKERIRLEARYRKRVKESIRAIGGKLKNGVPENRKEIVALTDVVHNI